MNYRKELFRQKKEGVEEIPGFDNIRYNFLTTATSALTLLQARYSFGIRKGNPKSIENPLFLEILLRLYPISTTVSTKFLLLQT